MFEPVGLHHSVACNGVAYAVPVPIVIEFEPCMMNREMPGERVLQINNGVTFGFSSIYQSSAHHAEITAFGIVTCDRAIDRRAQTIHHEQSSPGWYSRFQFQIPEKCVKHIERGRQALLVRLDKSIAHENWP